MACYLFSISIKPLLYCTDDLSSKFNENAVEKNDLDFHSRRWKCLSIFFTTIQYVQFRTSMIRTPTFWVCPPSHLWTNSIYSPSYTISNFEGNHGTFPQAKTVKGKISLGQRGKLPGKVFILMNSIFHEPNNIISWYIKPNFHQRRLVPVRVSTEYPRMHANLVILVKKSYHTDNINFTDRWTDGQTQAMTIPLQPERPRGKNYYE